MAEVLQIPSLGLELSVMNEWNYDLLQMAPCRYRGSVGTEDLILLGLDYQSHFGKLEQLQDIYYLCLSALPAGSIVWSFVVFWKRKLFAS